MEPIADVAVAARRPWRLLVTEPCDGATNMAIDEAVFRGRQAGTSPPTLRFFAWAPPTVSIGYGQPLDRHVDGETCRALGVGLVRRPTGGSAIYHDGPERELTYSVIASAGDLAAASRGDRAWRDDPAAARDRRVERDDPAPASGDGTAVDASGVVDLLGTYHWIARALCRGLRALGAPAEIIAVSATGGPTPAFCFARTGRYELEVGGRKIVGSAQRRQGTSFLQHGSVLLGVDEPRVRALFPTTLDPLSTLTTLEAATGRRPTFDECASALEAAFEAEHGLDLRPGGLSEQECEDVDRLVNDRYSTQAWLAGAA